MQDLLDCENMIGFSIINPTRNKPPKVKIGSGAKFFTGEKFGSLEVLGKVFRASGSLELAVDQSGVSRRRAIRFLVSLGLYLPKYRLNKTFRYKKIEFIKCDVCGVELQKATPRQKRHVGRCYELHKRLTVFKYR